MTKFSVGEKVWVLLNDDECIGMITEVVPVTFVDDVQVYGVRLKASVANSKIYVSEKSLRTTDFQKAWRERE